MLAITYSVLQDILIPGIVVLVGGAAVAGVLVIRFRGSSLEELRASLATAKMEIDIANQRADRLSEQIEKLTERITALESENAILRGAISSGKQLAPEFGEIILRELKAHEVRVTEIMSRKLDEWEAYVRIRHLRFLEALPPEVGTALKKAVEKE